MATGSASVAAAFGSGFGGGSGGALGALGASAASPSSSSSAKAAVSSWRHGYQPLRSAPPSVDAAGIAGVGGGGGAGLGLGLGLSGGAKAVVSGAASKVATAPSMPVVVTVSAPVAASSSTPVRPRAALWRRPATSLPCGYHQMLLPSPASAPATGATQQAPYLRHLPVEGLMLIKQTTSSVWESVGPSQPEATFFCPFCLENVRISDRVTFAACGNDSHGVCRECMGRYVRGCVADGPVRVGMIMCEKCQARASPEEVFELTDAATFRKYERFREMQQDPTVRECPKCTKLNKPQRDEDGNTISEMHCEDCGSEFCYYHSNAHQGLPCSEYRKRVAREERLANQGALRDTKACPVCGVRTEKTGGCNHMTCQQCGADWCWVCNKKLDDVTAHYYFAGPLACGQFDDFDPHHSLACVIRFICIPVQICSTVVFILMGLTLLFWFPVVFLLFLPCSLNKSKCEVATWRGVFFFSMSLAFMPFVVLQVLWTMLAGILWSMLRLCGAQRRHLYTLVRAPLLAILPVLICFQVLHDTLYRATEAHESGGSSPENRAGPPAGDVANAGVADAEESSDAEASMNESLSDSSSGTGTDRSSSDDDVDVAALPV